MQWSTDTGLPFRGGGLRFYRLTFSGCRHGTQPDERRGSQRGDCYEMDSSMSASVVLWLGEDVLGSHSRSWGSLIIGSAGVGSRAVSQSGQWTFRAVL